MHFGNLKFIWNEGQLIACSHTPRDVLHFWLWPNEYPQQLLHYYDNNKTLHEFSDFPLGSIPVEKFDSGALESKETVLTPLPTFFPYGKRHGKRQARLQLLSGCFLPLTNLTRFMFSVIGQNAQLSRGTLESYWIISLPGTEGPYVQLFFYRLIHPTHDLTQNSLPVLGRALANPQLQSHLSTTTLLLRSFKIQYLSNIKSPPCFPPVVFPWVYDAKQTVDQDWEVRCYLLLFTIMEALFAAIYSFYFRLGTSGYSPPPLLAEGPIHEPSLFCFCTMMEMNIWKCRNLLKFRNTLVPFHT